MVTDAPPEMRDHPQRRKKLWTKALAQKSFQMTAKDGKSAASF
jgi:hypothetical protein